MNKYKENVDIMSKITSVIEKEWVNLISNFLDKTKIVQKLANDLWKTVFFKENFTDKLKNSKFTWYFKKI